MGLFNKNKNQKQNNDEPVKDVFDRTFEMLDLQKRQQIEYAIKNQPKSISEKHSNFVSDFDMVLASSNNNIQMQKTERIKPKKQVNYDNASQMPEASLVGVSSVIGRRESQQDALAVSDVKIPKKFSSKWMAVLCDGMGGMKGGEQASALCVKNMIESFAVNEKPIPQFYRESIADIDNQISMLKDDEGNYLGAGTTIVSVVIDNDNLYWGAVGDSHIYIIRNEEMALVNTEHNYMIELLEQVNRGEITMEQANNDKKKDALISYMGMGGVSIMDVIEKPFKLKKGDFVILCSDGLYRSLSDNEIFNIVKLNADNMQIAARQLTDYALSKNNPYQDNTSVITIRYI